MRRRGYGPPMNNTDRERLGAALRSLRRDAGLTQHQVAAALGMAPSTISDIECGKREPGFWAVVQIMLHCKGRLTMDLQSGARCWRVGPRE